MSPNSAVFEHIPGIPPAVSFYSRHFGVDSGVFEHVVFFRTRGRDDVWMLTAELSTLTATIEALERGLPGRVHAPGVRVCRAAPPASHPDTSFLRWLAPHTTRNLVSLSVEDAERFMHRERVTVPTGADVDTSMMRYVAVEWAGMFLGRAIVDNLAPEGPELVSQVSGSATLAPGFSLTR